VVTLAATAAVRAGVAIAIAERDRQATRRRRRRERQFGLLPGEGTVQGLRRMLLSQIDLATELLAAENGQIPTAEAVHDTRKALKRLRALVTLLEDELGAAASAREELALREAGRRLAGMRDTEVMVSTLEALMRRHPRKLGRRAGIRRLRTLLVAERDRAAQQTLTDAAMRARVLADLRSARTRMASYRLPDSASQDGLWSVEPALGGIYRRGRRRHRRAARGSRAERGLLLHRWRKRVKDLRYACEALDRRNPDSRPRRIPGRPRAKARSRAGGRDVQQAGSGYIGRIARRADRLGELLGSEHDLVLLAEWLQAHPHCAGRRTRTLLQDTIDRRRKVLQRRALRDGERLFRRAPKKLLARVRADHALASRPA